MPRKKRAFIDRKNAQHYVLAHKTRDELEKAGGDDGGSKYVLLPVSYAGKGAGNAGGAVNEPEAISLDDALAAIDPTLEADHVNWLGLPNDGYDYDQHIRAGGGGTFVSATPEQAALNALLSQERSAPGETEAPGVGGSGKLAGITLSDAAMEADIAEALFGEDVEVFEDLNDDFLLQAGGVTEDGIADWLGGEEAGAEEKGAEPFDEQEYMAAHIAASRQAMMYRAAMDDWSDDEDDEDAANDHSRRPLTEEEQRIAHEFEITMQGYDSDEIGELDDPEACVTGPGAMEAGFSEAVDVLLDEFIEQQKGEKLQISFRGPGDYKLADDDDDDVPLLVKAADVLAGVLPPEPAEESKATAAPAPVPAPASAAAAPAAGTTATDFKALAAAALAEQQAEATQDYDAEEALDGLGELSVVDDILDKQSYLRPREEEEWDCESVLSTLSTTDNLPSMITHPKRRSKKGRAPSADADGADLDDAGDAGAGAPAQILLSNKTGIPLGVLPVTEKSDRERQGNLGVARDRNETKEDKRARKAAIKAERRARRAEKKAAREQMTAQA